MEPLDESITIHIKYDYITMVNMLMQAMHANFLSSTTIRIRGGGGDGMDDRWNVIPSLSNTKFMWNGLPCIDFPEIVMYPLNAGLGSMMEAGDSLLKCAQRRDHGMCVKTCRVVMFAR